MQQPLSHLGGGTSMVRRRGLGTHGERHYKPIMRFPPNLQPATLIVRLNRFVALVRVGKREVQAHVANSGRLREFFQPGREALLVPKGGAHRKTSYDLLLVRMPTGLVSVDARLPPHLVQEAFEAERLPQFGEYSQARREVVYGNSRLDLMLAGAGPACLIEVKSVTLIANGRALFPDAPTERGRRHVGELDQAKKEGLRAAIVFVLQRADASAFSPNDEGDPSFGDALRDAASRGVEIYAYRCNVSEQEIVILNEVPVLL